MPGRWGGIPSAGVRRDGCCGPTKPTVHILKIIFQVVYVAGVVYGAYYSADLSHASFTIRTVPVNNAVIGGFLLSFGSLMCGGSVR